MARPGDSPPRIRPVGPNDPAEVGGYQVAGVLGDGGMGRVYLCRTPDGGPVAVKVVRAEYSGDLAFRKRFEQEVETARRVQGPYTAPVVDADPHAEQPWLATAYVPGPSLQQAVDGTGPLPAEEVPRLVAGVAEALRSIHAAGVVHRDLKPSNVILSPDGPRVIDFGIARAADVTSMTATGVTPGTPAYMAPEYIRGQAATSAADVWALGVLANFAATGRLAFGGGRDMAVTYRILEQQPDLTGCPEPLRGIVRRCLEKNPAKRPTPAEVIRLCRNALPDEVTVPAAEPTTVLIRRPSRKAALAASLALVVALAVAAVLVLPDMFGRSSAGQGTPPATSAPESSAPVEIECGGKARLAGAGASSQNAAIDLFAQAYGDRCPGAEFGYSPVGSGAGKEEFFGGRVDFAGSDSPLSITAGEASRAATRCQGNPVWHLPMVINPVAIGYRIDGVDDLVLTGPVLAKIFNGSITTWDHPEIAAVNASVRLPAQPIQMIFRSDPSVTTETFQSYLAVASGGVWTGSTGNTFTGRTGDGAQGVSGVAEAIAARPGAIGYVDWQEATSARLHTARLDSGTGPVALTADSAAAAVTAPPVAETDLVLVPAYSSPEPGAFPLVRVGYLIVCSKGNAPQTAVALRAFLTTAATDGQLALPGAGFAPVPPDLRDRLLEAINAIA